MRNNQKEAKLKVNIAELTGPLLKRLELAKEKVPEKREIEEIENIIDNIRREVENTKVSFDSIQNWEWLLIGLFGKIERQINPWIDDNEKRVEMNESTVMTELNDILDKLSQISTVKAPDLPDQEGKTTEVPESSKRSHQDHELSKDLKDLEELDACSSLCLYSLGIFPENTELEKRFVIYWWIGLGLLPQTGWKEAKKRGDEIYDDLNMKGFLQSVHIENRDEVINRCTINPTVHKWLLPPTKDNVIFRFDQKKHISSPFFGDWFKEKVLVNLDQKYLNSDDIRHHDNLQVVQLGSWCYTETKETGPKKPMSIDHIEIDKTDFLKNLGEKVTYLSLRGISGIEEIHESIGKLVNLIILDLRACHNLIKLPQKPRSRQKPKQKSSRWKVPRQRWLKKLIASELPQESWFNKLIVLDISECYLMDHMPKWICELPNLEVLKGFVVGSIGNKNQSCRLSDLSKLNNLKKLTIRIGGDHSVTEDFSGLKSLHELSVLTITWGDNKYSSLIPANCFPMNLEKLDIRCYPVNEASEMLKPAELKNIKKLYIRGGKLAKIPCNESWNVEILRLRFLKNLDDPPNLEDLRRGFSSLKYVEYVECPGLKNFPMDRISWSKEMDELSQSANASETSN